MTKPVIEIVTFKLAKGVDIAEFLANAPASTAFLKSRPGFRARRLSAGEDGHWLEHIEWGSMAEAQAAAEAFVQAQHLKPFTRCLDMESVEMRHQALQLSEG